MDVLLGEARIVRLGGTSRRPGPVGRRHGSPGWAPRTSHPNARLSSRRRSIADRRRGRPVGPRAPSSYWLSSAVAPESPEAKGRDGARPKPRRGGTCAKTRGGSTMLPKSDAWFEEAKRESSRWYWWGIPTFFRCPWVEDPSRCDVALVGVPHS